ncbi:MAG: septal ring lytic transglycosylase RlpA family protein [Candidatus Electrothrix sp. AR4]|nr:septal ring lytic transglycosylase RlpA family protein [Candidatus Electrothrix sp. AR4]
MKTNRVRKKIFKLAPFLCLLLIAHGCGSKKNLDTEIPPETDIRINEIQIKEPKAKKEKGQDRKEEKRKGKKGKGKKRQPATQRPYVIKKKTYYPIPSADGYVEKGIASWYGGMFHGRKTANGETYDMRGDTAAHKTLPMNTMLLVENLVNGKSTVVRINDRGPFVAGRIIDLSYTTAQELGVVKNGTEMVRITALGEEDVTASAEDSSILSELEHQAKENQNETEVIQLAALSRKRPKEFFEKAAIRPQSELGKKTKRKKLITQDFDRGNFYIQVGAFEHKKEARILAQAFADKGRNVIIQQFPAAGISLFRVMIFSSTSLKAAKSHKEKLEGAGFPNALVIARDKKRKKQKELSENRRGEDRSVTVQTTPQATGG